MVELLCSRLLKNALSNTILIKWLKPLGLWHREIVLGTHHEHEAVVNVIWSRRVTFKITWQPTQTWTILQLLSHLSAYSRTKTESDRQCNIKFCWAPLTPSFMLHFTYYHSVSRWFRSIHSDVFVSTFYTTTCCLTILRLQSFYSI